MCNSVLGPMAQDTPVQDIPIPMQDESLPQMDPKREMGAAAADFATPPLLRQIPSPAPSKTATDNGGSVSLPPICMQIVEAVTQMIKEEMGKMWGETQGVGQCLQADKMVTPRAATNVLKGSAPAGEDRVIRETRRTRHEVTEEKILNGVTETCTVRREVTELTETREITREVVERLHGVEEKDVVKDAHTHTHTVSEGRWG